jgi:hypothetical protein
VYYSTELKRGQIADLDELSARKAVAAALTLRECGIHLDLIPLGQGQLRDLCLEAFRGDDYLTCLPVVGSYLSEYPDNPIAAARTAGAPTAVMCALRRIRYDELVSKATESSEEGFAGKYLKDFGRIALTMLETNKDDFHVIDYLAIEDILREVLEE